MALTETQCRSADAGGLKVKKYFDGGGLCLQVSADGRKYWRLYYRMPGSKKQQVVSFGAYPKISLKQARLRRDEAKLMIADGKDPAMMSKLFRAGKAAAYANTFADVAMQWIEQAAVMKRWSEKHKSSTIARLETYMFPHIGYLPISEVEPMQILQVLRTMQEQGLTVEKLLSAVSRVFSYALITNRCTYNPAADLHLLLAPHKSTPFRHLTDPAEIGRLLVALDEYEGMPQSRVMSQVQPLIFIRPSELRLMRWDEIDVELRTWTRPPPKEKKKNVYTVPFSRQAWVLIESLRKVTGRTPYVFCNLHKGKPLSDAAAKKVLIQVGYSDRVTPHGWRHTASTLLHDQDYNTLWVESQLGHADKNKTRGTYNHAKYLEQRRTMLQEWADYLDGLKAAVM